MTGTLDLPKLAGDLVDDDSVELDGGRKLRLLQDPDYDVSINDFDCYGKVEYIEPRRRGQSRPEGFDGFARKIWTHDGSCYWWQPPADLRGAKPTHPIVVDADGVRHVRPDVVIDQIASLGRLVRNILDFGFVCVGVEVIATCDGCHQERVLTTAFVGGVEPLTDREYMVDIVQDLITQALSDISA